VLDNTILLKKAEEVGGKQKKTRGRGSDERIAIGD